MGEHNKNGEMDNKSASKKEKILRMLNSVIKKSTAAEEASVYAELKSLKRIIEDTRAEIGMARASDIKSKDIPVATDELDAVIEATADASSKIMDACDAIQTKATEMGGEAADAIVSEAVKIYEACSFQDITGQRIRKVVKTLKNIEDRVEKLVAVLGASLENSESEEPKVTGDAALLNGPQLPGNAVTQADIDKLLEEFG